ncbi:ABC transporter ATP-binding protein [Actinobacteria bacterium YIM 96077]|uniref:ABC transporter ATP-binding protein n=1 Tax=Phytoactinopolyspora halophila TaxID=1981511 RepID=A0A329QN66_9ACTN|nr:ABC transporter ATP-binding protein [Phytoactinopolyspora halophila]AYY12286.1 ABC transporter ATP-binding protein [Actinobacteria bacterium YIM 96077]RAW13797.1 ABC transporter ATP-binding protein [Phytoactinopolyspora halophila]
MLSIENLRCAYGTAEILRGIDMDVHVGEVVALLGRNGMGKTSLVRSVAGTRPPVVSGGTIRWAGTDTTHAPSHERARLGMGLVPQGRHVFSSLTVHENLTVAARRRQNGWDLDEVYAFFPRLQERSRSRGRNLSGGEQQMLAIGRALMTNPQLLLMDEPSEGLAPAVIAQIRERIQQLKGSDIAVLLVEQNLGLALSVADRVYILGDEGRVAWHGQASELEADDDAQQRLLAV